MEGQSIYSVDTFVLSFFIYSVIGWVCEVLYCSVPRKKFVNRGFMLGPWLPIYGSGAMTVIVLLEPFKSHWYLLFIFAVILTSSIEYFTSFALEKIFHVKLWDYSTYPLNLNGRICALNSSLFGLLSLFLVYVVNNPVYSFVSGLNELAVNILSLVVVAVMSGDFATSVVKMAGFRKAVDEINLYKKEAEERLKELREASSENFRRYSEKIEERRQKHYARIRRIMNANPSLTFKGTSQARVKEQLAQVKETLEEMRIERKKAKAKKKSERKRNR